MSFPAVYITQRFSGIRQNLYAYAAEKKQEQIHWLRVDIKKIRALLSFLNKMDDTEKLPKKMLRRLFNDAGILRENHINMGIFKKVSYSGKLLTGLSEKQKLLETQFIDKISRYLAGVKRAEKKLRLPHHKLKKKELKKYFIAQVSNAENLFYDRGDKKNIHRFRIRIKKMMYLYHALPAGLQKSTGLNAAYLNKLQTVAGKWHDSFMAVRFLENNDLGPAAYIKKLKQQESRQLDLLVKACKNFTQRIITSN